MSLWSIGRYDLRLSESEFWALTPRQFDALLKRVEYHREHRELLNGVCTSALVNTSSVYKSAMCTDNPPGMTSPADFMPSRAHHETEPKEVEPMTDEQRARVDATIRSFFGAAIKRGKA